MGATTMNYHIFGLETWTRKVQEFTSRRSATICNNVARDFPPEKKICEAIQSFESFILGGCVIHSEL